MPLLQYLLYNAYRHVSENSAISLSIKSNSLVGQNFDAISHSQLEVSSHSFQIGMFTHVPKKNYFSKCNVLEKLN